MGENRNELAHLQEITDARQESVVAHVKAVNREDREILHLITTGARDRAGDVVTPKGAQLKNYRKNPVVLVNHDYRVESVIGRAVHIDVAKDGIWARTKFLDTPVAESAFNLAAESLGGWSIGFKPMKGHSIGQGADDKCPVCTEIFSELAEGKKPGDRVPGTWGQHFLTWELLEYSSVAVPMNQEIVNNAVQRGLVPETHVETFFNITQGAKSVPSIETEPDPPVEKTAAKPTVDPAIVQRIAAPALKRIDDIFARAEAASRAREITKNL